MALTGGVPRSVSGASAGSSASRPAVSPMLVRSASTSITLLGSFLPAMRRSDAGQRRAPMGERGGMIPYTPEQGDETMNSWLPEGYAAVSDVARVHPVAPPLAFFATTERPSSLGRRVGQVGKRARRAPIERRPLSARGGARARGHFGSSG